MSAPQIENTKDEMAELREEIVMELAAGCAVGIALVVGILTNYLVGLLTCVVLIAAIIFGILRFAGATKETSGGDLL